MKGKLILAPRGLSVKRVVVDANMLLTLLLGTPPAGWWKDSLLQQLVTAGHAGTIGAWFGMSEKLVMTEKGTLAVVPGFDLPFLYCTGGDEMLLSPAITSLSAKGLVSIWLPGAKLETKDLSQTLSITTEHAKITSVFDAGDVDKAVSTLFLGAEKHGIPIMTDLSLEGSESQTPLTPEAPKPEEDAVLPGKVNVTSGKVANDDKRRADSLDLNKSVNDWFR